MVGIFTHSRYGSAPNQTAVRGLAVKLSDECLTGGGSDAGIRVPANGFIRDVCRLHGGALALSSANISGGRSPVEISEFRELWPQCAAVFDGGTIRGAGRHGSTIFDLSEPGSFRILRRGDEQLAAQYAQQLRAVFRLEQRK